MTTIEIRRHLDILNIAPEARNEMERRELTPNYTLADLLDMVAFFYFSNCREMVASAWTPGHCFTTATVSVKGMMLTLKIGQPSHPRIKLPKQGILGTVGHSEAGLPAIISIYEDDEIGDIMTTLTVLDMFMPDTKVKLPTFKPFIQEMGEPRYIKPASKKRRKRDGQQKVA